MPPISCQSNYRKPHADRSTHQRPGEQPGDTFIGHTRLPQPPPIRMSKYDDLFAETAPTDSVFADKGALDPLAEPAEIHARNAQERELARILTGVDDGSHPPTVSVDGPPGTGKTLTTRREFAARHDAVMVEYVTLTECRTLFSAANENV